MPGTIYYQTYDSTVDIRGTVQCFPLSYNFRLGAVLYLECQDNLNAENTDIAEVISQTYILKVDNPYSPAYKGVYPNVPPINTYDLAIGETVPVSIKNPNGSFNFARSYTVIEKFDNYMYRVIKYQYPKP